LIKTKVAGESSPADFYQMCSIFSQKTLLVAGVLFITTDRSIDLRLRNWP